MVKTPHFSAGGAGSIPSQGAKIPHAGGCGQKNQNKPISSNEIAYGSPVYKTNKNVVTLEM